VNEPWWSIPIEPLKQFYWDSYQIVQAAAPHWITMFHDSFRLSADTWKGFLMDCPNFAFDTHIYQAWSDPLGPQWFLEDACKAGNHLRDMEDMGIPIIVGEWSLATGVDR
jgi:glucan 1,3-beta-glucosidase